MMRFCASIVSRKSPARMNSALVMQTVPFDLIPLFEHDLFGKPVPTFPDHALDTQIPGRIQDKIRGAFAYHAYGRVGVAARNDRDDGGLRDAQTLDAANRQPLTDDRQTVVAHLAGAAGMKEGRTTGPH